MHIVCLKISLVFIFILQGFHKWKRNVNHIWQLLLYTRRIFYKIDLSSPLNMEAANMYQKDLEQFKARAKSCVIDGKEQLYLIKDHPDPHYLTFSSFHKQIHGPVRDKRNSETHGDNGKREENGRVYVATGSLTIFSEKPSPKSNEGL